MTQNLGGQPQDWLKSLCNHFALPIPKFSLGQPVTITWYSDKRRADVQESGFIVGIASTHQEFLVGGWYYSVWLVESSIDSCVYPTLNDWAPENELTPWEV